MTEFIKSILGPVRHGLIMAVIALIFGAMWAGFLATNHETLHGRFEAQEQTRQAADMDMSGMGMGHPHAAEDAQDHKHAAATQHSHSGNLAMDAMQRLLRGHIHFMGLGVLVSTLLLITAFTSLKSGWKKVLGWTFGIGALAYPPAWIMMGLRTVELGPQAAEASVMWLFGPAVGLLLASMAAVLGVLIIEALSLHRRFTWLSVFFEPDRT
ncbi:MAG: hypothetical protein R8K46_10665 [Mariprofundaceae bacterium]